MHFATLGLLRSLRSPKNVEVAVSSSPRKFRVKLDVKIKRALLFLRIAPEFLANCSSIFEPRLRKEGAVKEFQVGDMCKASVAQKQFREVILLRGSFG